MTGSATASAAAPSPEPRTMPTRGASAPSRDLQKRGCLCDLVVVGHMLNSCCCASDILPFSLPGGYAKQRSLRDSDLSEATAITFCGFKADV